MRDASLSDSALPPRPWGRADWVHHCALHLGLLCLEEDALRVCDIAEDLWARAGHADPLHAAQRVAAELMGGGSRTSTAGA